MIKRLLKNVIRKWEHFSTYRILKKCHSVGQGCRISMPVTTHCLENITIGNNFSCGERLKLRTFNDWMGHKLSPSIVIGNNVTVESDCHFSAINSITIGNNVLIASFVFISDHSHGSLNDEDIILPPLQRPLFSKGSIIIEDNVWIGEKACILPGVTIGRGAIIGAGSIVTHDIPPFSVAAGIPAKVIRHIK